MRPDNVPLLWKNDTYRDPSPLGISGATQFFRSTYRVAQDHHGRHVGERGVVRFCLAFGDAHCGADLVAPFAMGHAADDPVGNPRQNGPGLLSQEFKVARYERMKGEGSGDIKGHVILVPRGGAGQRGRFLPGWCALPGKLKTPSAAQPRIANGVGKRARSVVENAFGDVRLQEAEDRNDEGLDVPHHVAIVVVVIMPSRETEDRG